MKKQFKKRLCFIFCITQSITFSMDRVSFDDYSLQAHEALKNHNRNQEQQALQERADKNIQRKLPVTGSLSAHKDVISNDALKNNISLDPEKLSATDSYQADQNDIDLEAVKHYLEKLPKKNQPSDMNQALQFIKDGAIVSGLIEQGKFFSAIEHNFSGNSSISNKDKVLVRNAFNLSDSDFWAIIKNDKNLAKKVGHHNIPFTVESLQSVEYGMYFRSTYVRIYIESSLPEIVEAYQKSIIQLQWHLFSKSTLQEERAFSSGMISLQDPKFALFKFLDGYAELISPKYKLHDAISVHSLTTTKAYTRESSHYTGAKRFKFDCGIDIQDSNNQPLSILPGNKSHILFGLRSNDMFFVKWENYGVTINPLEKDMSLVPHIKGYFNKKDKHDDPVLERREKISDDVMQEFKKLYGSKKILPKDKEGIDKLGISYMMSKLDPKSQEAFKNYLVNVKKYSADSLSLRKGNEIILPTNG